MLPQLAGLALGIWLMASPQALGYDGAARVSALIAGPLAVSMSWIALSEVTRSVPASAALNSVVAGLSLGALALLPAPVKCRYGSGWAGLLHRRSDHA